MEEGGGQQICIVIDMGTVGEDDLVINVVDIPGGTAIRNKKWPSFHA